MNIQEALNNYNSMKAKISILQAKIEKINNEIIDIQGVKYDGLPKKVGYVESSLEYQIINKQKRVENKEKEIKELKNEIDIIEKLVKTLKKNYQDIIEMRYYMNMTIEQIANQKDKTYNTIAKIIQKSITKMQNEYDKNEKD